MVTGSWFQSCEPVTEKARRPNLSVMNYCHIGLCELLFIFLCVLRYYTINDIINTFSVTNPAEDDEYDDDADDDNDKLDNNS